MTQLSHVNKLGSCQEVNELPNTKFPPVTIGLLSDLVRNVMLVTPSQSVAWSRNEIPQPAKITSSPIKGENQSPESTDRERQSQQDFFCFFLLLEAKRRGLKKIGKRFGMSKGCQDGEKNFAELSLVNFCCFPCFEFF